MKIAVIGAGNVGRALGSSAVRADHAVILTSRDPDDAAAAAVEIGAQTSATNRTAAEQSDIVILAVPTDARTAVVSELGDALSGKIVIDVSNRPTPDATGGTGPTSMAEELQAQLPLASVVKAFNTTLAARQVEPLVGDIAIDGFVAGDDETAKKTVLDLVASLGFRPIDAGPLLFARTLEGMGWLNISLNMAGGTWQESWKLLGPDSID